MCGVKEINGKFTVGLVMGDTPTDFCYREFNTEEEAEAFILGIEAMNGWNDYRFIEDMDEDNEKELFDLDEDVFDEYKKYKEMVA